MTSETSDDLPVTIADMADPAPVQAAGEAAEREKPPSLWSYPATYLLIGVNVVVYAMMFHAGPVLGLIRHHQWGDILTAQFDYGTLLNFGGCDAALVLNNMQWWRLLTAAFVHVTLLHILLNMWCLWNLGVFGEPLLGRRGLVAVYMLTGVAGNMLSLASSAFSHTGTIELGGSSDALVVGASGAVFGIAGILIVLLSNRKLSLPWEELRSLRRQVIFFAVANLAIGMAPEAIAMLSDAQLRAVHLNLASLPRIDNTAHMGGFLSGLALGLPLFPRMTSGKQSYRQRQRATFAFAALLLCLIGYALKAFAR